MLAEALAGGQLQSLSLRGRGSMRGAWFAYGQRFGLSQMKLPHLRELRVDHGPCLTLDASHLTALT